MRRGIQVGLIKKQNSTFSQSVVSKKTVLVAAVGNEPATSSMTADQPHRVQEIHAKQYEKKDCCRIAGHRSKMHHSLQARRRKNQFLQCVTDCL